MGAKAVLAPAGPGDAAAWQALRTALWPDDGDGHAEEIAAALARNDPGRLTLLAFVDGAAVGLAEATIRHDYVNGCDTSPVVFLEGLFVAAGQRRQGIARQLVERVTAWAGAAGVRELASDAAADNHASHALHRALGFAETERVVFFRRDLAA